MFFPPTSFIFHTIFCISPNWNNWDSNRWSFNEPLPFANILLKETGEGVTSDFDGKYSFELEENLYPSVFFCRL